MHRQRVLGGLILLGAILFAALLIVLRTEPEEKAPEDLIPLVEAKTLEIRSGNLMVKGAGTVRAREELTLAAEVAGKLVYVNPDLREGQRISRGAILFRIDTSDYRNAVQTAQADVASQGITVLQAKEEVALAKAELERFQQRGVSGGNAYASVDSSDYAAQILPPDALAKKTGPDAPQARQKIATNGLATRQPQLESARAGLRRAQANLANAETALQRTVVRAPFSGIVRTENIALGSYVQPGQSLGSMVGTADYEAVIPLSEKDAALIPQLFRAGTGNRIAASVFSDYGGVRYRWSAYIDRVNGLLNPKTRTIDVFLRVPKPISGGVPTAVADNSGKTATAAPPLFVGSFVDAEITGRALDSYAVLPLAALRAGNKIWLVQNGKLHIMTVDIYQRTDKTALISSRGLGKNPVAVTRNLKVATEGLRIRIAQPRVAAKASKASASKAKTKAKPVK